MDTVPGTEDWKSRPTLTVWSYDSPMGAAAGHVRLRELQRRGAVSVEDAVTVTWVRGTHRPRIGRLRGTPTSGHRASQSYSVLGALAGLLTIVPGGREPVAELAERLEGTGLDARVLGELRAAISPGWSVLLVLSTGADPDQVRPAIQRGLARGDVRMTHAVLSVDGVPSLREAVDVLILASSRSHESPTT